MEPKKTHVFRDPPDGCDPVVLEIWPDGEMVLRQGSNTILISEDQADRLSKHLWK
jgi:hypothetical protein